MTHDGLGKIPGRHDPKSAWLSLPISLNFCATQKRTWSSTSCPLARRWRPNGTWNKSSKRDARSSAGFLFFHRLVTEYWGKRFADAGLTILGDDVKSSRRDDPPSSITRCSWIAIEIDHVSTQRRQHRFPQHARARTTREQEISKTNAVTAIPLQMGPKDVHVGASDHVPWLTDRLVVSRTRSAILPLVEVKLEV